ncbi:proteinase/capsid scaffold protein [Harp seal herpesvirus]|uniref:Capsid scaffolding protein n=1 Tax=phocid gammaherpesvirus 3 TaxID=2560643 RepID=A0A0R5WUP5_9GAMA|nr:proteinase/capsid scaffold protein [Harp seal herpesvirus]AJG42943.1 proteinase/capsid scaffold protein [Harp seal herpesvirus]
MPIFVAGFVDVFGYEDPDQSLYLDTQEITKHLPIPTVIPLTIEHQEEAQIGWVLCLHKVSHGLFCLGEINSSSFLQILTKVCNRSVMAHTPPKNLPPHPEIEMLQSWLPELSLSSLSPDLVTPDLAKGALFQHVSVCAMGKRRGTIALYGDNVAWLVSKFTALSLDESEKIISTIDVDKTYKDPPFTCSLELLVAKAIDAGFIKNRLTILRDDKGIATVRAPTYLKASAQPSVSQSEPVHREDLTTLPKNMNTHVGGPAPAGSDDLISIPRGAFMSLLQNNLDAKQPPLATASGQYRPSNYAFTDPSQRLQPPPAAFMGPGHPFIHYAPQTVPYYVQWPSMEQYGFEGMACLGGGPYFPVPHPSRPNKRKREPEADDGAFFPGEDASKGKELQTLSKTIAELQNEIKELKNTAMGKTRVKEVNTFPGPILQAHPDCPIFSAGLAFQHPTAPQPPYFQNPPNPIYQFYQPKTTSSIHEPSPDTQKTQTVSKQNVNCVSNEKVMPVHESMDQGQQEAAATKHAGKQQKLSTVNASMPPTEPAPINPLQKLFCDELLKH